MFEWMKYVLILLGVLLVAFLVWKAFIKSGKDNLKAAEKRNEGLQEEIDRLKDTIHKLDRQLDEISRSKLNVAELTPILHVAVLNIDTNFVRTYVREKGKTVFNGAIRADICAEYGIRLEDVRFKYDHLENILYLADFHPGLISYSKKQLSWEIARSVRRRSLLGHEFSAISDNETDLYTKTCCDEIRAELEKEIDSRSIAEFDWLAPMIAQQVSDLLKMIVKIPGMKIAVSENPDGDFLDFQSFQRSLAEPVARDEQPTEAEALAEKA